MLISVLSATGSGTFLPASPAPVPAAVSEISRTGRGRRPSSPAGSGCAPEWANGSAQRGPTVRTKAGRGRAAALAISACWKGG